MPEWSTIEFQHIAIDIQHTALLANNQIRLLLFGGQW